MNRTLIRIVAAATLLYVVPFLRADDAPDTAKLAEASKPYFVLARTLTTFQGLVSESTQTQTPCLEATLSFSLDQNGKTQRATGKLVYQKPDKLRLEIHHPDLDAEMVRNGNTLAIYTPGKKFGVLGKPDVARWRGQPFSDADKVANKIPALQWPLNNNLLFFLPTAVNAKFAAPEKIGDVECQVIEATPNKQTFPKVSVSAKIWIRPDSLPARIEALGEDWKAKLEITDAKLSATIDPKQFEFQKPTDARIEEVAVGHLVRFFEVLPLALLGSKDPDIKKHAADGPMRVLIAREGNGYLERVHGTLVLHLQGTPEEMGWQHGKLLAPKIRDVAERIVYGVGVGSSFDKGRWFFGEIEDAYKRLSSFIDDDSKREAVALAKGAGMDPNELRLANVFPELFHCSGFAVYGKATVGGALYHGRVLDYMRGVGLEPNAVVIVNQPTGKNAWVNISYAGFIGSVTAMNEKKIAIGEMGGRGEGNWDGKPMAHLLREIMEKANTLDEAVEIMRKGPRTCEYYYVISDAKTKQAVGIAATPTEFTVVKAGEANERLPRPFADCVLLSADKRYNALCDKVQAQYGKIDAPAAIELMKRPVAMKSNLHAVLFAPDTLDFWVANASAKNPACDNPFTHYNLTELLTKQPPVTDPH